MLLARVVLPERTVFVCRLPEREAFKAGEMCIVELDYGRDLGKILEIFPLEDEERSGGKIPAFRVIRHPNEDDSLQAGENRKVAQEIVRDFLSLASRDHAGARVWHARISLNRKRVFVRYAATGLVKIQPIKRQLERKYMLRIDFWAINLREEASRIGGIGVCGRPLCCACWMHQFPAVNIRMAKEQEMGTNPSNVNGLCNRLKCCIGFECGESCCCLRQTEETGKESPEGEKERP